MSDRERYRSIGGIDDPPSHPLDHINLPFAPPSHTTSRNSCPSATCDGFLPISFVSPSSSTGWTPIANHTIASASSGRDVVSDAVPNSCDACGEGTGSSTPGFPRSAQPVARSIYTVCSHPSQGAGRPDLPHHVRSSQSSNHSAMQAPSTIVATDSLAAGYRFDTASGMGHDESDDFTSTTSSTGAPSPRLYERAIPDTASYHAFGRPSDVIGSTKASSSLPQARRPSPSVPIATSCSGSCASIHTFELCRDDSSFDANPSGEGRSNEEYHRAECGPPVPIGSPPDAGSSAPLGDEVFSRRPSETSGDTSALESVQAGQKQVGEAKNVFDDLDLAYILPEGSIRSFHSRLSFIQGHSGRPLSSHISSIVPFAISERSLSIEDQFLRHLRKYDKNFDSSRHYWSFTRVKEYPSMSSGPSKQIQPPSHSRLSDPDQAQTDVSSRMQETWRCGHVGRFRVRRTVFEPRSADPTKGVVQQIHVRQIMDQKATNDCYSVIHKHPRATAFSIFRTPNPFAGGKAGKASTSTPPTHMNIRAGIMLAPKKVQQKYANTKSTSELGTHVDSPDLNKGPSAAPRDRKGKDKYNSDRGEPSSVTNRRHPFPWAGSARESAASPISSPPSRLHSDNHASNVFEYDRSAIPLVPLPRSTEPHRPDANSRGPSDLGPTLTERFFRIVRGSSRTDTPSPSLAGKLQSIISPSRSPQEEIDLVNNLNASFKAVGLLPSKTGQPSRSPLKRKSDPTFLGQIPEDCLCMTFPLWASETSPASVRPNGLFLIVYYVPIEEVGSQGDNAKKSKREARKSTSGVDPDFEAAHLPAFRVVARIIDQSELLQSGFRVPSEGLAVDSPEREAVGYPASDPHQKGELTNTVVCYCYGREGGFDFVEDGLYQLGLCTQEEDQIHHFPVPEEDVQEGEILLTPIGKAVVEIIWLGCLAVTSSQAGPI